MSKTELLKEVAHLLNEMRLELDDAGRPLNNKNENLFWAFINSLPKRTQESVIN